MFVCSVEGTPTGVNANLEDRFQEAAAEKPTPITTNVDESALKNMEDWIATEGSM